MLKLNLIILALSFSYSTFASDYSFSLSNTIESNFLDSESSDHYSLNLTQLNISFNSKKTGPFNVLLTTSRPFKYERKLKIGNTYLSFSRNITDELYRFHGLLFPTSDVSRGNSMILGAINKVGINKKYKYFNLILNVGHQFNFHEFETAKDGDSNYEQAITAAALFQKNITENFSGTLGASYRQDLTYLSNHVETFIHFQTLSYSKGRFSTSLSHTFGGSLFAPDGRNFGIEIFDTQNSTFSFTFAVQL